MQASYLCYASRCSCSDGMVVESLLDKQDDLDPHRIKLIDGIPNCPDAECLQRVLNRTQKVWNDFGGRKVTKPKKKEKNYEYDDSTDEDDVSDDKYFDSADDPAR